MSHEKAIQQCGNFLDRIGIPPDKRDRQDSTGNAAKAVSRLEPGALTGAISSRAAAKAYGLSVLAENIQDGKRNRTHFILLENMAAVAPKTVGIIGIEGRYGTALKAHFTRIGCRIIGADKNAKGLTNIQVVKQADVVVFAIPISETVGTIRSVARYARKDQLFMDITSVKRPAVDAMSAGKAQVLGLHPMFAPEVSFAGQTIVACPVRLTIPSWKTWVVNMLASTGAKIKWSTPAEHDLYMTTVQSSPHLANLVNATLLVQMGVSATESLEYTSPFYRVMFSLMGRLLSQNPNLYSSILMENPDTCPMLERRIRIERRILRMIRAKDDAAFCQLFAQAKTHFGEPVTKEANELFLRLIAVTTTLYNQNSVILEFTREHSRPGLLERILRVFRRRGVNLSGINFVGLDDKHQQFTVAFERSRDSDEVRRALQEIESWDDPRVKALT
jgi:prephenate dehydrogenase